VKRVLIGAGLIVALAFPATIIASIRHYEGTVDGGGITRFVTKVRHGETIKVKRFVFNHVPMQCDDGASTVGDVASPPPAMRVNARHRFHGSFTSGGGSRHLHIQGRLRHQDERARGFLRVRGDFGGGATNCDTGKAHWHAARGSGG
jgi:hypothetical protein